MATASYYFDAYSGTNNWTTSPGNMVDGDTGTFASTTARLTDYQDNTGNTCAGTNLGTITKVEIRAYAYYSVSGGSTLRMVPYFGGSSAGDNHDYAMGTSAAWSSWFDITNDTNAPGTWAWSDIDDLDVRVACTWGTGSRTNYCAKIEIQVTYTPGGTNYSDSVTLAKYAAATDGGGAASYGASTLTRAAAVNRSGGATAYGSSTLARYVTATDGGKATAYGSSTLARYHTVTDGGLVASYGQATLARYHALTDTGLATASGFATLARQIGVSENALAMMFGALTIGRLADISELGGLVVLGDIVLARLAAFVDAGNLAQTAAIDLEFMLMDELWGTAAASASTTIGRFAGTGDLGNRQAYTAIDKMEVKLAAALTATGLHPGSTSMGIVLSVGSAGGLYIVGDTETTALLEMLVDDDLGIQGQVQLGSILEVAFDHFTAIQVGIELGKNLDMLSTTGQFAVDVVLLDRQMATTLLGEAATLRTISLGYSMGLTGLSTLVLGSTAEVARFLAMTISTSAHYTASVALSRLAEVATSSRLGLYATIGALGRIGEVSTSALMAGLATLIETRRLFLTTSKQIGRVPAPTQLHESLSARFQAVVARRSGTALGKRMQMSFDVLEIEHDTDIHVGPVSILPQTYSLYLIAEPHSTSPRVDMHSLSVAANPYSLSARVNANSLSVRIRYGAN